MIQPLRKLHRRIFYLLAMVLPIFFIAGIRCRHRVLHSRISPSSEAPLPGSAAAPEPRELRAGAPR